MKNQLTLLLLLALLFPFSHALTQDYPGHLLLLHIERPIPIYKDITQQLAFSITDRRDICRNVTNRVSWATEDAHVRHFVGNKWQIHPLKPSGEVTIFMETDDGKWTELGKFQFTTVEADYDDPYFQQNFPQEHLDNPLQYSESFFPPEDQLVPNEHYNLTPYTAIVEDFQPGATQRIMVQYLEQCKESPDISIKVKKGSVTPAEGWNEFFVEVPKGAKKVPIDFYIEKDGKEEFMVQLEYPVLEE